MTHGFQSFDGERIAWVEKGEGRPVILIHGLFSHGDLNWLRFGHAERIAAAGFRVIMPDLRGHGASARPRDPAKWPPDVLARDIVALAGHLRLEAGAFDLGGYSLGARTTIRSIALGLRPRRAVIGGMGLEGLTGASRRRDFFTNAIRNRETNPVGSAAWYSVQFAKSNGIDFESIEHLVADFGDFTDAELTDTVSCPALVVCGVDDRDNGSAPALARLLVHATLAEIPGNHVSAVTGPALGEAIAAFLRADQPSG